MLNISDKVKVIQLTDETADNSHLNQVGVITDKNTNGLTGNTEDDPLWVVSFDGNESAEYWTEELELIKT